MSVHDPTCCTEDKDECDDNKEGREARDVGHLDGRLCISGDCVADEGDGMLFDQEKKLELMN